MICSNCGKEIEKGIRFCTYCGADTLNLKDTVCPICGWRPFEPGKEFCDECGFRLLNPTSRLEKVYREPENDTTPGGTAKESETAGSMLGIETEGPVGINMKGYCYATGSGGQPLDAVQARKCFEIAASYGYAPAQYNLAAFYAQGLGGLDKDVYKAEIWMKRAADQKLPQACRAMSLFFLGGGTAVNGVEGLLPIIGAGRRGLKLLSSKIYQWELLK